MTTDETRLWQIFMTAKGVFNNFAYFYRNNRFDEREMDKYLEDVKAEDAIMSAFSFSGSGNSIFGYKYWKELDDKWQAKLCEFRKTGDMPTQTQYCPNCKRTLPVAAFGRKKNGVLHKHCKACESGDWANKMSKICTHCGARKPKTEFYSSKTSADGLQDWCKQCQIEAYNVSNREDRKQEQQEAPRSKAVVPGVLLPDRLKSPRLGEYDATLHYKKGQKNITFNATLSEQVRKGQYTKCYLNPDRQMRQFLIFNRVEGANVTGTGTTAQPLVNVNSSDMVRALAARFNLEEGDNYYLHITKNLSKVDDFLTVEVLKVRTREEYVRIVEKREEAYRKGSPVAGEDVPEYDGYEPPEVQDVMPVSQPSPLPEPEKEPEEEVADAPLLDFGLDFGDGRSAPPPADKVLQTVIDRQLVTERDMAAFLYNKGWKLQEPVVVTTHKKFSI